MQILVDRLCLEEILGPRIDYSDASLGGGDSCSFSLVADANVAVVVGAQFVIAAYTDL